MRTRKIKISAMMFVEAERRLVDNWNSRGYRHPDAARKITPEQHIAYAKAEIREWEELVKKYGGEKEVAAGYENKSPLLQKHRIVFSDGSKTAWRN